MIRIKVEEEEVTPIESENERIKRLLSLKFSSNNNNLNNVVSDSTILTTTTSDTNSSNFSGALKLPENNVVVPMKVVSKKQKKKKPKQKLDNSTTNSVVDVGSKSIKTEPAESSLSLTTQLNHSLNIQSLLRQNRIQNGWTTNEQSIPIGTQQQQQQSFLTKIEPIVSEIHQEVPLFFDQSSSFPNLNSKETTTTATNCDTNIMKIFGPRAYFCRRTKLNVCYSVPKKPEVPRRITKVPETLPTLPKEKCGEYQRKQQWKTQNRMNLAAAQNSESNQHSGSGSISGVDPSSESSSSSTVPSLPPEAAVPLLVEKKALIPVPPLTLSLEEKKARQRETSLRSYHRQRANLVDPEIKAEKLRQKREYHQKHRQQLLATGTPEQLELRKLKDKERFKRFMEKESEEQREKRREQKRQYYLTVRKQRREQKRQTMTPEEREKKRAICREYNYRTKKNKMEKKSLEESLIAQSQISIS